MRMALELSKDDHSYQNLAVKFFEHYVYIASALEFSEEREVQIWDEEDGFFYDVLCIPGKVEEQIKVRSLVGIIPLYAVDVISDDELEELPEFKTSFELVFEKSPRSHPAVCDTNRQRRQNVLPSRSDARQADENAF